MRFRVQIDEQERESMIALSQFEKDSFERGAPVWKEVLWWGVRAVIFSHAMPVPSLIKVWMLRGFGAKVGRGVVIRSRVNITFPWRFECGDHVWIGDEVLILSLAPVTIGSNVCLSQRAFLCTGSHDFQATGFDLITKPIVVGDSCWVGAQAFVAPGVTFGAGSRCGAGSVVTRDVAPGMSVHGVPARPVSTHGPTESSRDTLKCSL